MRNLDVNSDMLRAAGARERLSTALLFLPGALVVLIAVGPALWLAIQSLISDGSFSMVHYQRIWDNASYSAIILTTLKLSAVVTAVVVLVGYPATYAITLLPPRLTLIALSCVAIPFWTSLLVRTYAWMVILQRRGVLNEILLDLGLIERPLRMANSFFGTTIGMVHIMLPFFIFPLYAAMRAIDGNLLRAAYSLGATPSRAFRDVFLPLSRHGVLAGALLTFVLCLGFYVTPQLLGGGNVTTISMKIQQNVIVYSDWGAASALGVVLVFVVTLILAGIRLLGGRSDA